ncbi:MAG: PAS domain S-box protein, partial [Alphaproteobacteria bacterium]|nr:PAS domain S-box protein [Alphaproteobacteria bacterium]
MLPPNALPDPDAPAPDSAGTAAVPALPYAALFRDAGVAMCVTDAAGRFRDVNAAFCALYGHDRAALIGASHAMILPEGERHRADEAIAALVAEGRPVSTSWRGRRQDGTPIDVRTTTRLLPGSAEPLILSTVIDVTELLAAERRATISEGSLRRAQEVASLGYWRYDPATDTVEWSDGIFHIFGRPRQPSLPLSQILDWIAPEDRDRVVDLLAETQADGQRRTFTYTAIRPDGERRTFRGECMAERRSDAGSAIVALVGVIQDITDSVQDRAALAGAQALLAESERLLMRAQEVARVGHFRIDLETNHLTWSENNYRLHGLEPDGSITVDAAVAMIHEGDRQGVVDAVKASVAAVRDRVDLDYRIVDRDGAVRFVHTSVSAETDGAGRAVRLFGITQDVTDRVRIEHELRRQKQEAEAANKAKSDFLAHMSHELRTPLNAILGFSELMSAEMLGPLGSARYRDYAGTINESGRHLLTLINDVLDMSKVEAGRYDLAIRPTPVRPVLENAVRLLSLKAHEGEVTVTIAPGDAVAAADDRALKQVAINLLSNAIKFTAAGGRVDLSVRGGDEVVIEVADTGVGIAPDDMDRILEPFGQVRAAASRSQPGTGLGLPLSKRLVELMAGTLEIDSRP